MNSLKKAANVALKVCMGLNKKDNVLVIYDSQKKKIANSIFSVASNIGKNVHALKIKEPKVNGEEPSKKTALEMLKYDVIIMVTSKSLSHTNARRNACKYGARIASMPGITKDMFIRTMNANYKKIDKNTTKLSRILTKGKNVKITTKKGTNVDLSIKGRKSSEGALITKKSQFDNLPSGESSIGPIEGTTNGVLIVDASMAGVGKVKNLKIEFKDGFAVKITGDKSKDLKKMLDGIKHKNAYAVAELGIGTNDKAKITGKILEDEKVLGTAHIALGNNKSYGGKLDVPIHLDGIFKDPTIFIDNKKIMVDGKLII